MKWLNGYRMRFVLVGFVAAIVLGGGNAKADFTFGEPTLFDEPVNSSEIEYFNCISSDGLEVYIEKPVSGSIKDGNWDIYISTRATTNDPWSVPESLGPTVNGPINDICASLSSDELELYFSGRRAGGYGQQDLWVTTRDSKDSDWGTPVNLEPPINTSSNDLTPWIAQDGLELYFSSARSGGYGDHDIWVATRVTPNDEWGEPVNLGPPVNTAAAEYYPCLSPDGLVLFFSDWDNPSYGFRLGGHGRSDIWMTRRKSIVDPWEEPVNLGPGINTNAFDCQPRFSPDGSVLYFTSTRPYVGTFFSNTDIYQTPIIPIVDLNNDLKVDLNDMHIIVDHWGTDNSLCDIGPMPWGDGIVDIKDLTVLAKHMYRLTAHWKFDETEGSIAHDSFGDYNGTLNGNPSWQTTDGIVNGALLFDGVDDYVSTPFILDPSKGSFSIFAWVYCWTPGQAIISQTGDFGETWLGMDASEGKLVTGFCDIDFDPLESEAVITDIQWHHIGLVYDFDVFHRRLYVDGVLVAEDSTIVAGAPSDGSLYIGASKDLNAGSFFSGLIDDVRIYNQALGTEEIAALVQ